MSTQPNVTQRSNPRNISIVRSNDDDDVCDLFANDSGLNVALQNNDICDLFANDSGLNVALQNNDICDLFANDSGLNVALQNNALTPLQV